MVRKRSGWWLLALTLLSGTALPISPALAGTGNINFTIGQKSLDSADWGVLNQQTAFGAEAAFGKVKWPVLIAAYFCRSSGTVDSTLEDAFGEPFLVHDQYTTQEIGAGLNKTLTVHQRIHPYLSAGGMMGRVSETFKQSGISVSRGAGHIGFWSSLGAFYRMGTRFNIGGIVRYSSATVSLKELPVGANLTLPPQDISEGGWTYGVLIGWGWPATK
jgi:hypothetical protein